MPKTGFDKIHHTDNLLFGPRALLLCGFTSEVQSKFKMLLERLEIVDLPLVWLPREKSADPIGTLIELPDGTGAGRSSDLPRAVIVSGISENELHRLMTGCRQAGLTQTLWAALTPTSMQWSLGKLLAELNAERRAMSAGKKGARS